MKTTSVFRVLSAAMVFAVSSSQIHAAGFQLIENSASGQGNAYSGAAATASDASTVWFNPAGMSSLNKSEVLAVGHVIRPTSSFTNTGSTIATGAAMSGANDDGGATALVPNLYLVMPLDEKITLGFGMTAPFGLATLYNDDWVGRYLAVETDLKTINLNPSIAYQVSDKLSVGGGLDIMLADVTLSNAIDFGSLVGAPQAVDGFATLRADNLDSLGDAALGFNLGLLYELDEQITLGVTYRSEITLKVTGTADFTVPAAAAPVTAGGLFQDSAISGEVSLPQSLSVSIKQDMDKLTMLYDITWTGWSKFEELRIIYANPAQPDSVTTENWNDSFRYSVGADYRYSDSLILRTGVAFDETPIPNATRRTPRVPGNDRTWISFGASYVVDNAITLDVGYSHLFISDAAINNTFESSNAALAATLTGTYKASVDILSAQARMKF